MTEYKTVIFDFGGVLTSSPVDRIDAFAEASGLAREALRPLFADHDGAWSRLERGELDREAFVGAFEAEARALGHAVDGAAFLAAFFGGFTLREEMVAVVAQLRKRMPVGCITNNVQIGQPVSSVVLDQFFDVVIESSKVGLRKPDPRIYRMACERLGVEPHEAIFLDDFGVNLKAARALGMATIKVDASDSAIGELEGLLGMALRVSE